MEATVKMVHGSQLQPETIVPLVADTEDQLWNQGGISDDREESLLYDSADLGHMILQHGGSVKTVHNYFAKLEQRKCCLLLAACRQRFTSVRLVRSDGRDSGIEEGAMMKSAVGDIDTVACLDEIEFKVFQSALMCAAFPVLGAPDPPSGATPSPSNVPTDKRLELPSHLMTKKQQLSHVMHDSGVEDQEEVMSLVPAETLCELLRRAFRLTQERFNQYEELVAAQMEKKSPQKILAEELVKQLVHLENNSNPFYNPKTFLNRLGYDQWQQRERIHITELLNKFWHFSLPKPSTKTMLILPVNVQYKLLMEKLIRYESPHRQHNDINAPSHKSLLSSASICLLKEFGLRYGVGDQYTQIVYLHYLAVNFDPSIWFIQHLMGTLCTLMDSLPDKRSFLVMVKEEYTVLESTLKLLDSKTLAAIAKMKTLFTDQNPTEGIECLIELVSCVIKAKAYLLLQPPDQLGTKLYEIVKTIFPQTYERHKITSKDELRQSKWEVGLSPKLINMMIGHIRDEVQDFKQNYQQAFQRFFNITVEAAQEYYRLLMADCEELIRQNQDKKGVFEIDKLTLSLAYRLNQLDYGWSNYISQQMQTWRELFLKEAHHWAIVLKYQMQSFVTQAVAIDKYTGCDVHLVGSLQQSSSLRSHRNRTASSSLNPSENSAFSSLLSMHSHPGPSTSAFSQPPVIPEVHSEHSIRPKSPKFPVLGLTDTPCEIKSPLLDRRPNSDPVNISHSSILSGSYLGDMARSLGHYDNEQFLTFTHIRHSSSLPDIYTGKRYIEMLPTSVQSPEVIPEQTKSPTHLVAKNTSGDLLSPSAESADGDKISPEVSDLLKDPVKNKGQDDTDDSSTLTDDSSSPDVDFNFPPIQEIKSSTPVSYMENKPVTVLSDMVGGTTIVKPLARDMKLSDQNKLNNSTHRNATSGLKNHRHADNDIVVLTDEMNSSLGNQGHPSRSQNIYIENRYRYPDISANDGFTDSLRSNVSFPHPYESGNQVITSLPISSAAVDVMVTLQRIVGMGKALCRTLTPLSTVEQSDNSSVPDRQDNLPPGLKRCRKKLYENFLHAIRAVVCVYADNMLCMDLCGTSNAIARRLAGPQLVQYLQTQQESDLVWGCRHDLRGNKNCFEFLDKQSALLCDRHEPITREMCTRINNVSLMLTCLEWHHRYLGNTFGIFSDLSVKQLRASLQTSISSLENMRSDFVVLEDYGYDPKMDKADVMETASQLAPSVRSGTESNIVVTSPIDPDKDHIKAILRAQCRLMAYRLNLFVKDALPVLLTLKAPTVALDVGLKPVTDFLASYVMVLKQWLYKDSFIRVLECLWIFIVQDFEVELGKLERLEEDTERQGLLLLQSLAHFLKFMNNQNENLKRELLLSQAEDVSFRLSLFSMPVSQLITIYRGLVKDLYTAETGSTDSDELHSVLLVRDKLRHDLQTLRKGFSGNDLVRWVLRNQQLFANFDPILSESNMKFTSDTAILVAQQLLEWGLIADVEGDRMGRDSPTLSLQSFQFPDMTIHAEVEVTEDRPFSRISDDSTPQATPRATPKPALRTSIRALSRQSRLKSITPGLFASKSQRLQNKSNRALEYSGNEYRQPVRTTERFNSENSDMQPDKELDIEVAENFSSGNFEQSQGQEVVNVTGSHTQGQEAVVELTGSQEFASLDSIDSEPQYTFEYSKHRVQQAPGFDPYLRGTPMSVGSGMSCESRAARFIDSSDKFYYVCPNVGNELETSLKNYELFQLVEDCFKRKVTPEYILRIIYNRRKVDQRARQFLKSAPPNMLNSVRLDEDVSFCASS